MSSKNKSTRKRQKKARRAREKARKRDRRRRAANTARGRSHTSKLSYESKEEALIAASRAGRQGETVALRAYRCRYCGKWHLTSKPDWNEKPD